MLLCYITAPLPITLLRHWVDQNKIFIWRLQMNLFWENMTIKIFTVKNRIYTLRTYLFAFILHNQIEILFVDDDADYKFDGNDIG